MQWTPEYSASGNEKINQNAVLRRFPLLIPPPRVESVLPLHSTLPRPQVSLSTTGRRSLGKCLSRLYLDRTLFHSSIETSVSPHGLVVILSSAWRFMRLRVTVTIISSEEHDIVVLALSP